MPPSSTRLLPLCIAFLLGATTTTTMAAPAADAATNDILTTLNLDEVLAKRQSALGPHYIDAIWTTSSIESVNLGGGRQIVHNSGFSLADEEGNKYHLVQRLSSRLTTHRAKMEGPNCSIDRRMYSGQDIFQYSDVRRTLVGSRNLVRWRIRKGIVLASADGDTSEFFQWGSVGMSGYCGLSFSVGRECCLYGSFGRYRGLLS